MASVELCKDKHPTKTLPLELEIGEWSIGRSLDCDVRASKRAASPLAR